MYLSPTDGGFSWARLIFGIIALIFIPGYCIVQTFFQAKQPIEKIWFSLVFGLLVQTFNVLVLYSLGSLFFYEQINFGLVIIGLTFSFVFMFCILQTFRRKNIFNDKNLPLDEKVWIFLRNNKLLIIIWGIAIFSRLFFQNFSFSPPTDSALYSEMARNLVTTGNFTSKVIDHMVHFSYNSLGFSSHPFTYFNIAIFFLMGGTSYLSAKLMIVFYGSLMIFPVYGVANELYGKNVAVIAAMITSIHPWLIFFSSALFTGSEILSALFVITAFYFFLISRKSNRLRDTITTGLFVVLVLGTWYPNYFVILGVIFFSFMSTLIHRNVEIKKRVIDTCLLVLLFSSLFFVTIIFVVRPDYYMTTSIPVTVWLFYIIVPILFVFTLIKERKNLWMFNICCLIITIYLILQFYWIRTFYLTQFLRHAGTVTTLETLQSTWIQYVLSYLVRSIYDFLNRSYLYWQLTITYITPVIAILCLLHFLKISRWKDNFFLSSFPFFHYLLSIVIVFSTPYSPQITVIELPFWYRFVVAVAPFYIILSASTLLWLVQAVHSQLNGER